MPTLGAPLDFAKLEGRNFQAHQLGSDPSSPVKGQLYYNTGDNTLYWWDGSQWVSARGGTAATPPATTSSLGTVQLAGDLAGTATSPQIAAGAVTDVEVAAANKDGAVGTASMRTIGTGAQQAMAGSTRLDQVPAPLGSVNLNGQKIVGLMDPTIAADAATKLYVDSVAQGLDAKASVRLASTGSIAPPTGLPTIDGVAVVAGDRILLKNQSDPTQNGIWIAAAGAWSRATDVDTWNELVSAYVWVELGTTQADTGWICTVDQGGTLGTTAVTWTQFSGAAQITAGGGMTKTGNTLDVGSGAGIQVNADTVQVANNGITNAMLADGAVDLATADVTNTLPVTKGGTGGATASAGRTGLVASGYYSSATHSAGTTITITAATHGLRATRGLIVQCQVEATGAVVIPDVSVAANGDVTVTFAVSQGANTIRTTVIG